VPLFTSEGTSANEMPTIFPISGDFFKLSTVYTYMITTSESSVRYLSKAAAQELWQDRLTKNQIPLNSVTARCIFDETQSSRRCVLPQLELERAFLR
jgi:hypothetical protein